jgi:hypothetical protein
MIPNQLLSEVTKIQQLNVEDAIVDGQFPASGSFIDVSKFHRFAFLVMVGALDSALTCKVQQAAAINGVLKDVTSATVAIAANGDDKWYLIEVETNHLDSNNGYKYVTLDIAGAAGGNDYAAILFLGLNPGMAPVTQGADKGTIVSVVG